VPPPGSPVKSRIIAFWRKSRPPPIDLRRQSELGKPGNHPWEEVIDVRFEVVKESVPAIATSKGP